MESSKIKLRYKDRDVMFKKEYSQLKIKVALNWFEIFALLILTFFVSLKICLSVNLGNITVSIILSVVAAIGILKVFLSNDLLLQK